MNRDEEKSTSTEDAAVAIFPLNLAGWERRKGGEGGRGEKVVTVGTHDSPIEASRHRKQSEKVGTSL